MTEVEKFIKKLHRLEKSGDLEVEHLLKALKISDPALIEPLREMSRQYDWQPMNDDLIAPMAAWVDAICIYLESGVAGLIKAINRPNRFFRIVFGRGATAARGLGCVFAAGRGVRARYTA